MKRIIDYFLNEWKNRSHRKPLLVRGALQVCKTHAIRVLGKSFATTYPLYAIAKLFFDTNEAMRDALMSLFADQ